MRTEESIREEIEDLEDLLHLAGAITYGEYDKAMELSIKNLKYRLKGLKDRLEESE